MLMCGWDNAGSKGCRKAFRWGHWRGKSTQWPIFRTFGLLLRRDIHLELRPSDWTLYFPVHLPPGQTTTPQKFFFFFFFASIAMQSEWFLPVAKSWTAAVEPQTGPIYRTSAACTTRFTKYDGLRPPGGARRFWQMSDGVYHITDETHAWITMMKSPEMTITTLKCLARRMLGSRLAWIHKVNSNC